MLISGENAFTWLVIGGLIEMIALIIINSDYFRKRQHLFNN
ncbi:hypothetical protein SDC9_142157 [bioreactor metagenome]|uniref:Uncharacterized protein n=1 Tax=bioreactor metagenome TaxID=1076179 RepID=A0A645E0W3_9ZZZZ